MSGRKKYQSDIRYMKSYGSRQWVDIVEYYKEMKAKHPNATVHIGTDSQYTNGYANYVTVLAFRFSKRGVVGLYKVTKEVVNASKDDIKLPKKRRKRKRNRRKNNAAIKERLIRETVLTLELVYYLKHVVKDINITIDGIDLDYNNHSHHLSNQVLNQCRGMVTGFSNYVTYKNIGDKVQVATPFADKLCRKI